MSAALQSTKSEPGDLAAQDQLQAKQADEQIVLDFLTALEHMITPDTDSADLNAFSRYLSRLPTIRPQHVAQVIAAGTRTCGLPQAVNRQQFLPDFAPEVRVALAKRYSVK